MNKVRAAFLLMGLMLGGCISKNQIKLIKAAHEYNPFYCFLNRFALVFISGELYRLNRLYLAEIPSIDGDALLKDFSDNFKQDALLEIFYGSQTYSKTIYVSALRPGMFKETVHVDKFRKHDISLNEEYTDAVCDHSDSLVAAGYVKNIPDRARARLEMKYGGKSVFFDLIYWKTEWKLCGVEEYCGKQ